MASDEFWLTPMGLFLDLWTCHRQWLGLEKPFIEHSVDEVIPVGLM